MLILINAINIYIKFNLLSMIKFIFIVFKMENQDIIFSEFEFTHGINLPKIVVFQVNAAK